MRREDRPMKIVKDLMVPLNEYTRVAEGASLYDAMKALENALVGPLAGPERPRDRAVLVQAADGRVLGKLSMWDILRGLEPRYGLPIDPLVLVDEYFTWTHSMFANLSDKSRAIKARDLLRQHPREELIDENAPLDLAVHQLVHGRLASLLVTRGDAIVGVLRLTDVFRAVSEMTNAAAEPATA
jgi:CBS domain-containing protein